MQAFSTFVWIPLAAIIGGFTLAIVEMFLKARANERRHRERVLMLEKGMELPQDAVEIHAQKPTDFPAGRAWLIILGTIMTAVGLGTIIILTVRQGIESGVSGIIPLLIGVAFFAAERLIAKLIVKR